MPRMTGAANSRNHSSQVSLEFRQSQRDVLVLRIDDDAHSSRGSEEHAFWSEHGVIGLF